MNTIAQTGGANDAPVIFLTSEEMINEERLGELARIAPHAELRYFADEAALMANIAEADIITGSLSEAALARATRLKWLHSWATGLNAQLFPAMVDSPVVLTCSKGNGAIPLTEHAMMLMLMLNRGASRWLDAQRERRWHRFFHGELNGLT